MSNHIEELEHELEQEQNVDDGIYEEEVAPARYDITSYGIDFDVDGVVKRVKRGDIYIPPFQRNFVWKMTESSRFIESLLLGLPVPGIFLAQDPETNKMLVIDGQQRLLSLKYFYEGFFNPKEDTTSKRIFKLMNVQEPYENITYESLQEKDRVNLDNCVIHATVVKQDAPADDDASIYHIFERLNSGGRKLTPQEIRTAVYHGKLLNLINYLNNHPSWREIFGPANDRMRDQELILRFFAMFEESDKYKKPMVDFLTVYTKNNRSLDDSKAKKLSELFKAVTDAFIASIERKVFRPARALNVALYEAAMVGLATRITNNKPVEKDIIKSCYTRLVEDCTFKNLISQSTTDQANVSERIAIARKIFMEA
jgi:hypothetical protein